jgi:hypothetical protein
MNAMRTQAPASRGQKLEGLIAAWFLALGSTVWGGESLTVKPPKHPTLNIFTNDYAQIPGRKLEEAEVMATRILSIAGINPSWHRCGEDEEASIGDPNASKPETKVRVYLVIIPRAMEAHWVSGPDSLGFAILPGGGKTGTVAYIFYHRVEELAATGGASAVQILGHVMAHEIGHLLLNTSTHSDVGIMQAYWQAEQMQLLIRGWLLFTDGQTRQMRSGLLVRQREVSVFQAETNRN